MSILKTKIHFVNKIVKEQKNEKILWNHVHR